jgi:hypothetical protein
VLGAGSCLGTMANIMLGDLVDKEHRNQG